MHNSEMFEVNVMNSRHTLHNALMCNINLNIHGFSDDKHFYM